jgi:hypothetical protein
MMGVCAQQEMNDPSLRHHMFNALVLPVLSYGAELWGGFSPCYLTDGYFKATHAEKVHTLFLRWFTGVSRSTHKRALVHAAGRQPIGAHWDAQTAAFWNHLAGMSDSRLARLAFKDNIALMQTGGECWASRSAQHFSAVGALGLAAFNHPCRPLWDRQVSTAQGISDSNQALWANFCQNPRTLPPHPVQLPHRTLYTYAAWFRQLSTDLHVHHNIPARRWKTVLRFCTGSHNLAIKAALWHKAHLHECVCPCCGTSAEDEAHMVLDCVAYAPFRASLPGLFGNLPADTCLAMQHVFSPNHFRALAPFLTSCFAHRQTCVDSGGPGLSPSLLPPLSPPRQVSAT